MAPRTFFWPMVMYWSLYKVDHIRGVVPLLAFWLNAAFKFIEEKNDV